MKLRLDRKNLKLEHILMIFYSIFMFFDAYCYFTWSTLNNHAINTMVKYIRMFLILALFAYAIVELFSSPQKRNVSSISNKKVYALYLLSILIIYLAVGGYPWTSVTVIVAITFILLNNEEKEYIFKTALIAFALMVLPSMIYYLLERIGVSIPHETLLSTHLMKRKMGWYYSRYPFGLITRESNMGQIDRYCGIFDESGYVGSLAALFVAGGYGKVGKKWIILLIIEGLFSWSMAFYIMLTIFFIVRAFLNGAVKLGGVLLIIILGISLFVNVDFNNPLIDYIQDRVDLNSLFLIKDNRLGSSADVVLNNFFRNGGIKFLFGYGYGAANNNPLIYGSSSYKMFIYDYGIVGTALFALYFISLSVIKKVDRTVLPFIIVFLASFYQRPYIFSAVYITIFAGAVSLHSEKKL